VAQEIPPAPVDTALAEPAETLPPPPPPPVRAALPVRLSFTGDINLGTTTLPDGVPPDDGRGLLDPVASLLTGHFVVGNMEGVLADSGTTTKCDPPPGSRRRSTNCYVFLTPTRLAPRLREAGFTHLNLANNHAHDYGVAGRLSTETALRSLGLEVYGPGGQISIDTVRSGDSLTIIGLIGFTTYPTAPNLLDIAASSALVDSVNRLVDVVVVTFHGGAEGTGALNVARGPEFLGREPRGDLRAWARAVIDAGADLVVGHGPHVLRGIEFYRERPIAYSLGNFLTYRGFNLAGPLGLTGILEIELDGRGAYRAGRFHPMVQVPRQGPRTDPGGSALALIRRLSAEDFGSSAAVVAADGTITPPEDPSP
jgi:Bacterial capsule synthesis protein PGA_cap